jgi:hypothetical protein
MAITRQTTNCAGNGRWRFLDTFVLAIAFSIASASIAVSIALNPLPPCIVRDSSENLADAPHSISLLGDNAYFT